ncbi:E3 SUMO-protein ligase PIAS2-like isoform X2 [Bolinopsis microptera]|uniref:E3 SUMO-protein ligase PIAS2-like isoform X2 n=1 Tax=Bolinopsis microptera TaxID=2820187 RepID=UPI003079B0B0
MNSADKPLRNSQAIEKEVLRRMVTNFRVQELQQLMSMCNRSRVGRKQELLSRALYLVKNINDVSKDCKVASSIRDLYNRRYPSRQMQIVGGMQDANCIPLPPTTEGDCAETSGAVQTSPTTGPRTNGYPSTSGGYSSTDSTADKAQVPVLPDVSFKDLPFYEELDVLIKPTSLVDHGPSRYQETALPFYLSQRQVQAIYDSRTMQPMQGGNVMSYNYMVQIQVRLCLLETSCEQADHFPAFCALKVNGNQAFSFQEPQSSNVKRPPSNPIDITGHCRLSSAYPNVLNVTWAANYGQRHCIVVRLVRQHNSQILLDRLKKHIRNVDHSKALIKEKLSCDDNEIATTSLRVSLLCPLSKARIQIPCRPTTCSHLQCFDASIFLQMNERKATWQCPVCDGAAKYGTLAIDAFFKLIISQSPDAEEIEVFPDGSWKALTNKPDPSPSESRSSSKPEAISVDSPESAGPSSSSPTTTATPAATAVHDIIDILSSDDEDCAPPPPKKQAVTVQQTSVIKTTPKPTEPPAKPDQNGFLGKLNGKNTVKRFTDKQATDNNTQARSLFTTENKLKGFETLMSMCQNSIPDGDPAFTNFMRELNKMRHFHRYQLEQQAGQPGAQKINHKTTPCAPN